MGGGGCRTLVNLYTCEDVTSRVDRVERCLTGVRRTRRNCSGTLRGTYAPAAAVFGRQRVRLYGSQKKRSCGLITVVVVFLSKRRHGKHDVSVVKTRPKC